MGVCQGCKWEMQANLGTELKPSKVAFGSFTTITFKLRNAIEILIKRYMKGIPL
jgi:hypothetical protein